MIDPFGRHVTYLRASVTDRCDFRCVYCMAEDMTFLPKADLLTLEELDRMCGAFIGLAGGYLSLVIAKIFVLDMTQGRGWIAVALVIFSRWRPWRAILGGLLFGGIEALIPRLQATGFPIPQYFMAMSPYAVTLAVLIFAAVQMRAGQDAPKALGVPYVREDRK